MFALHLLQFRSAVKIYVLSARVAAAKSIENTKGARRSLGRSVALGNCVASRGDQTERISFH